MTKQSFNFNSYLGKDWNDSRYMLKSATEIRALLHHLQKKHSHITGHIENSDEIFSTCILEIEKNHLIIDGVSDEALSNRILDCSQLLFSSFHASVPVLFSSSLIETQFFEESMAFSIPIPAELVWRQRREFYRVPVPISKPALCKMDLKAGEIARNPLSDISVGGLGLMVSESSTQLNRGLVVGGCQVDLPGFGSLRSDIQICNETLLELRNGRRVKRYGCQFVNLQQSGQSLVQRYVIKLETDMLATRPKD